MSARWLMQWSSLGIIKSHKLDKNSVALVDASIGTLALAIILVCIILMMGCTNIGESKPDIEPKEVRMMWTADECSNVHFIASLSYLCQIKGTDIKWDINETIASHYAPDGTYCFNQPQKIQYSNNGVHISFNTLNYPDYIGGRGIYNNSIVEWECVLR